MSPWLIVWYAFLVLGYLLAATLVAQVVREQRSPAGTIAWLLVIVLMPYVGVPLYLLIGGQKVRRLVSRKADLEWPTYQERLPSDLFYVDRLFRERGLSGVTVGNHLKLCRTGEEAFDEMVGLIGRARESIHITTFRLANDDVGRAVIDRLAARAREGVKVRLLMDDVGSIGANRRFLRPLVQAGGETAFFMPVLRIPMRGRTNLRNHRKMVVVDEQVVMAGGANIAWEYMGPQPESRRWRDLMFVIEGPAVQEYASIFRADWGFAKGQAFELSFRPATTAPVSPGGAVLQVIPSGPDVPGNPLYEMLLSAIFWARRRLWIVTPYFVPDETLAKALIIAAHRDVDVRLLVPEKSNLRLVDWARTPYLRDLRSAGGRILLYTPGMMHAKAMLMDDSLAVIGSANMDMRSLMLNYEVMMLAFSELEIQATGNWMADLMADTRPLNEESVSVWREFGEGLVRMMAPLL